MSIALCALWAVDFFRAFHGAIGLGMPNEPFRAFPKTLPDRSQDTARNPLRNRRRARPEILSKTDVFASLALTCPPAWTTITAY